MSNRKTCKKVQTRAAVFVAALGLAWVGAGCESEKRVPVYPVSGKVDVQGEAPAGALLVFHPKTPPPAELEVPKPIAKVKADGSFQLTTYQEGDGAPEGEYAVTVEWYPLVTKDGESTAGPNVLPTDYAKPESTPLKAVVGKERTDLKPIELKRGKSVTRAPSTPRRGPGDE